MNIHTDSLLGIFACVFLPKDPNDYLLEIIACDAFYIYRQDPETLYFLYLKKSQDNYNRYEKFEEGFVKVETALREIHFYPTQTYEENIGGGMGYDTTYYRHEKYNRIEKYKLIKRKSVYFKNEIEKKTYKNINTDPDYGRYMYANQNEAETIEMMQEVRSNLVNWRSRIENHARSLLKKNTPVKEIALTCELTVEEIRALQADEKFGTVDFARSS